MSQDLPPEVDAHLTKERDPRVRQMVQELIEKDMSPQFISDAMDKRVSSRTIYRWAKGESFPQNDKDLQVLVDLHAKWTTSRS